MVTFNEVRVFLWSWIPTGKAYAAITLPPFGIFMRKRMSPSGLGTEEGFKRLLDHELIHWEQYRRWGLLGYYGRYLVWLVAYGYKDHPMEVEARERSGIQ